MIDTDRAIASLTEAALFVGGIVLAFVLLGVWFASFLTACGWATYSDHSRVGPRARALAGVLAFLIPVAVLAAVRYAIGDAQ